MPGQFNNNMFLNPQMGMKPAPVQGGGMQQGMPMGGQGQPMPGGGMQQGMPMGGQGQPMPGGPQPMPKPPAQGGGMPPGMQFAATQLQNQFANPAAQYQSQMDDIQRRLMFAQNSGANPNIIADLQMQLQQAQGAMQEAAIRMAAGREQNRPAVSQGIGGAGPSPSMQRGQNNYDIQTQMLMALFGGGGGGYGPQIG